MGITFSSFGGFLDSMSKNLEALLTAASTIAGAEKKSSSVAVKHEAAVKLQKVYKSFRTRRQLADCAVLVEQRWWKLLDFAQLKRSSVSFFDLEKTESAISGWSRARTRAAKVGKGLSKDEKAQKLALQHWLEAIDPRHRYGHNLHFYYDCWRQCESMQPFFYWLDVGEGKEINLESKCERSILQRQCIKYLGPKEREDYQVVVEDGKLVYQQSRKLVDSSEGLEDEAKWIFVLSTSKKLYVGQKIKGRFQHSSFLAGGATSADGRLIAENGVLKAVWRHSGHYRQTEDNFKEFMNFLQENNVDLSNVKQSSTEEDGELVDPANGAVDLSCPVNSNDERCLADPKLEARGVERPSLENEVVPENSSVFQKKNLFLEEEIEEEVASELILRRMKNSKKGVRTYQLGEQLSCRWTTGAGPRIGCVREFPSELQLRALEQVKLSPRSAVVTSRFASQDAVE